MYACVFAYVSIMACMCVIVCGCNSVHTLNLWPIQTTTFVSISLCLTITVTVFVPIGVIQINILNSICQLFPFVTGEYIPAHTSH